MTKREDQLRERIHDVEEMLVQAAIMAHEARERAEAAEKERDEVRAILAGTDIGSLPNDYPTVTMAEKRMEDRDKFMWQVRDTCKRAEAAEKERDELKAMLERRGVVFGKELG